MSWAYWAPKSTTRTGPVPPEAPVPPMAPAPLMLAVLALLPACSACSDALVAELRMPATSEWYTASAYLGRRLAPRWLSWQPRGLGDPDLGDPAAIQLGHGQPAPVELG